MFNSSYEKEFAKWWHYYFIKELYGLTHDQMAEYSDYKPGSAWVEMSKMKAYSYYAKNNEHDQARLMTFVLVIQRNGIFFSINQKYHVALVGWYKLMWNLGG